MSESKLRLLRALTVFSLALLPAACKSQKSDDAPAVASAEQPISSVEHEHRAKRQLPPAAFDACQGKGLGDGCTVQLGERQVEAKCAAVPDGRLACRPARGHKKPEGS